jgi:3-oxoacyl-[acyl-carrier-protein] synthase II
MSDTTGQSPLASNRLNSIRTVLPADKVLVIVGTPCSISAVGSTETYLARARGSDDFILFAAFDAGLVELSLQPDGSIEARLPDGQPASIEQVEQLYGTQVRSHLGIRVVDELVGGDDPAVTDIAASLPHDLGRGALRGMAGLTYREIRDSELRDMHGLFDDDPRLGPSLQSQLFAYAGLGALASLPLPLSELVDPFDFRVSASAAFPGLDGLAEWRSPVASNNAEAGPRDKFAARLASSLASHGPALVSTMLAPSYPLSKSTKNPALLDSLRSESGYMRVPQAPMVSVGACASSLIGFCELAPQMLFDHPGFHRPKIALWTAADAGTQPGWKLLEAFGSGALMTTAKLNEINADRSPADRRSVGDSLAPFDIDANGTVAGDGGSGVLVTTLDFALRNFLDITAIIVGWGQSGEAGGKAHFAGVGFGGENALVHALEVAREGHGDGVGEFRYLVAHATGTRTNSKTDLTTVASGRAIAAERAGSTGPLPRIAVGTPKALGDGHTMGETGLKAVSQAIQYLLGETAIGVPTLRNLDPALAHLTEMFELAAAPVPGDADGGAICATQGFGGYNGAIAMRAANADTIARYSPEPAVLAAYLERWPTIRRDRQRFERLTRIRRGSALELAQVHRWTSPT